MAWSIVLVGSSIQRSGTAQEETYEILWYLLCVVDLVALTVAGAMAIRMAAGGSSAWDRVWFVISGSSKLACLVAMAMVLSRASLSMSEVILGVSTLVVVPVLAGLTSMEL